MYVVLGRLKFPLRAMGGHGGRGMVRFTLSNVVASSFTGLFKLIKIK